MNQDQQLLLQRRIDDALDDVPALVQVDPARAWASGRRRRTRRRVGAGVLAVTLVVLAAAGWGALPNLDDPAPADGGTVSGHPARLDHLWWDRTLPDDPGPLAGVVQRNGDGVSGWWAVSPTGRMWALPVDGATADFVPALSPDGARLGYLRGSPEDGTWVVQDLGTGATTTYDEIGTGLHDLSVEDRDTDHEYAAQSQSPHFWSPDSELLLLRATTTARSDVVALVLRPDGSVLRVPRPAGGGRAYHPVGWSSDDELLVAEVGLDDDRSVRVWVVSSDDGRPLRSFSLARPGRASAAGQWLGSASAETGLLATSTTEPYDDRPQPAVRTHALHGPRAGALVARHPAVVAPPDQCSASWSSEDLLLPSQASWVLGKGLALAGVDGRTVVLADPRLAVTCSMWARDALDGPAHDGLLGPMLADRTGWLAWHRRELALAILLLLAGSAAARVVRRRRSRLDA